LFGDRALDARRRVLTRHGALVDVEPKVLDVLLYPTEDRGRAVTKDHLPDARSLGEVRAFMCSTSRASSPAGV
jgi:DNA-binding response OmpR family regulator